MNVVLQSDSDAQLPSLGPNPVAAKPRPPRLHAAAAANLDAGASACAQAQLGSSGESAASSPLGSFGSAASSQIGSLGAGNEARASPLGGRPRCAEEL